MIGSLLNVALNAPDSISQGKKISQQQQQRRQPQPQIGTHAPGGAPPMRKVSELKKKLMKKQAGGGKLIDQKTLMTGLALAGSLGVLQAGGAMAAKGVGGTFQKFQANRVFKDLESRYPEIKRNPNSRKYFDLIVAYAPSLMRHHAAIGDFLRRQLEYPMSSVEFIKQLADLESTVQGTESRGRAAQFGQSLGQAGGYMTSIAPEAKI
jgi:hypothetical protein